MNEQAFSMLTGVIVIIGHVLITFLLLFYFDLPDGSKLGEITLPLTTAYVSTVVAWFFKTKGLITAKERVGLPLVFVVMIIVLGLFIGLFAVPFIVLNDPHGSLEALNDQYLFIEMAFGGIFGIVMSELFGYQDSSNS